MNKLVKHIRGKRKIEGFARESCMGLSRNDFGPNIGRTPCSRTLLASIFLMVYVQHKRACKDSRARNSGWKRL